MHRLSQLGHIDLVLLQIAIGQLLRHLHRVKGGLLGHQRQACTLLVQHLILAHLQCIFSIGHHQKLLGLSKLQPGLFIGKPHIKARNPTAIIIALYIIKIAIGTLMQYRYRLARVEHGFLQHIKILIGRIIEQALTRGQIAYRSASGGHSIAHRDRIRNGLNIGLGTQNIFIIFAYLIAV